MKKKWDLTVGIFRLIWKYQPSYYVISVLKILVTSALPLTAVWLPKGIMECLITGRDYRDVAALIGIYAGLLAGLGLADHFLSYYEEIRMMQLKNRLQREIGNAAMYAKLEEIESAAYQEEIMMAGSISGVTNVIRILQELGSCIVTIVGLAGVIVSFNALFVGLIAAVLAVKVIFTMIRFCAIVKARIEQARNDKVGAYLESLQYFNQGAQKEIRVNALYDWFFDKMKGFRDRMVSIQFVLMKQHQIFEMVSRCILAVQNFIILTVLAKYYMEGQISIADFTMNFSAIGTLSLTLSRAADQMMEYNLQMLNCRDYNKVVNPVGLRGSGDTAGGEKKSVNGWNSGRRGGSGQDSKGENFDRRGGSGQDSNGAAVSSAAELEVVDVVFRYPGTQADILKGVSLRIRAGEKIMLVGYNGEGKTTLIKLLCKFYRPDSGRILLDGKDIWEIPNEQYYRQIATVFQDFALFAFTIRENILMSNEKGDIGESIRLAGFERYVNGQKDKENTHITKLFDDNGVELSGGEEQKLAISRAIQKRASLVIFDEPTASLDVKTESEVYRTFADMTKGMTSIIISHRLSMADICDRIFVLDKGRIAESGSHGELMGQEGIYAAMYRRQSEAYAVGRKGLT